jgi:hypothetical protein
MFLDMDAHKLAGQTSLRSSKVSEDIASDLEKKMEDVCGIGLHRR